MRSAEASLSVLWQEDEAVAELLGSEVPYEARAGILKLDFWTEVL